MSACMQLPLRGRLAPIWRYTGPRPARAINTDLKTGAPPKGISRALRFALVGVLPPNSFIVALNLDWESERLPHGRCLIAHKALRLRGNIQAYASSRAALHDAAQGRTV